MLSVVTDAFPEEVPAGAWVGLCLACGAVKPWCARPCQECGAGKSQNPELDDVLSEEFLHRRSIEQLSGVLRRLLEAKVDKNLREWTLYSFLRTSHPTLFTMRVPRRICTAIDRIKQQYDLPPIEVLTSASVMPSDFNDHEAWDSYFSLWEPAGPYLGGAGLWNPSHWIDCLQQEGRHRLWVPGCGLSELPWVFAAAGFDVLATDASKVAIDIQARPEFRVDLLKQVTWLEPEVRERLERPELLSIQFAVHDFRTPLGDSGFDAIMNVLAFQSLSKCGIKLSAKVYWDALAPGGYAVFSMLNVPRRRAQIIERILAAAGFYIPLRAIEREEWRLMWWQGYPNLLNRHALGRSLARVFQNGGPLAPVARLRRERKLSRLKRARKSLEPEAERMKADGHTKIAELLYSTG